MNLRLVDIAMQAGVECNDQAIGKITQLIIHRVYAQIALVQIANMESEEISWCCAHLIEKVRSDFGISDDEQQWEG